MAWKRVVTQHMCAPVSVGGTPERRPEVGEDSKNCALTIVPDPTGPATLSPSLSAPARRDPDVSQTLARRARRWPDVPDVQMSRRCQTLPDAQGACTTCARRPG
eukprot:3016691-Prymnesium_polylepis.1